jgi:DNA polymerase (family 10)
MAGLNATIAAIFDEIADLLDIQSANTFRVRAYRNAARSIADLGTDVETWIAQGTPVTDIPGIGADLAAKIEEIARTGDCEFLKRLQEEVPPAIIQLMRVPGLGPKRVKLLWQALNVQTLEQLVEAGQAQRIRELPGFGEKTEKKILQAVQQKLAQAKRFALADAVQIAEPLAAYLRGIEGVGQVQVTGSYRRVRDTVGDLDVVVTAGPHSAVMQRLVQYPQVKDVLASGPTRATVRLASGMQVDLRVVPKESYGAALQYFTGSKAHNIVIRRAAQERGLKVNEYGVFRGEQRIAGESEESVYRCVDLPWIPPELREDRGEIEAAREGRLPKPVERADLKGDLHVRVAFGEERFLEELARAARKRGLGYLVVVAAAQPAAAGRTVREIQRVNAGHIGVTLLAGIEAGILEDGTLDVPDPALDSFDVVIASPRGALALPRAQQTDRVLRALDNRYINILAQPPISDGDSGTAFDIDTQRIARHARERRIAFELTADPHRHPGPDSHWRALKEEGALAALASYADHAGSLDMLSLAVGRARRAWLEKPDILNTRSLTELRDFLSR